MSDLVSRLSEAAAPDPAADDPPRLEDASGGRPLEEWADTPGRRRRRAARPRRPRARGGDLGGGHRRSGARGRTAARRPTGPPCRRARRAVPARPGGDRLPALRRPCSMPRRGRPGRCRPSSTPRPRGPRRSRPGRRRRPPEPTSPDWASPWTPTPCGRPATTRSPRAAQATALLPREERLVGLRRQVETYAARIAQLDSELVSHETTLARLPERLERCRADHRAAAAAVAALPGAESALEDLRKRVSAAAQHAALLPQLAEARAAQSAAVDEAQQLTEVWLRLREQRLEGMAAEMAVTLVVGGGCPVCGSEHHPHPARGRAGAPDAEAERQARKAVDDAEGARHAHDEHVRDLTTRIAMAELLSGSDRTRLAERVAEADAERLPGARARRDRAPGRPPACVTSRRRPTRSPGAGTRPASSTRAWSPPRRRSGPSSPPSPPRCRPRCGTPRTPTWPPGPPAWPTSRRCATRRSPPASGPTGPAPRPRAPRRP